MPFVDLTQALADADIDDAAALLNGNVSEVDVAVVLQFPYGSLASFAYGSTPPVVARNGSRCSPVRGS